MRPHFFRAACPKAPARALIYGAATVLVFHMLLPAPARAQTASQSGRSQRGMVAAGQPLATEAGVRMLEMGGNAADAAVAAAFAIAVVEPSMNSIGGRNQILIRTPDGSFHGIDGTTQAPLDYDPDAGPQASYGYAVIGIPGAVAGLMRLHSEYGSLPLETLMAPAIDYAENGYRLLPGEAGRQQGSEEQVSEFPGTRASYIESDGTAYDGGDLLVQRDYGRTLRAIARGGHDAFYRGGIAEMIAADMAANGGVVTMKALDDYEAEDSRIVRGSYRGYELVGMDVPAAGVLAIQALQIMENFDPGSMSEAEWAAVTGQALALAARELRVLGTDTAAARATSKEWAARMAREVKTPDQSPAGLDGPLSAAGLRQDEMGHTTHLTVADADGMFVSLTQTLGPAMGSKVVTPDLGFLYASTLGGYLGRMEGGERARSNICPFMVLKDGVVVLALGAAGGGRIPPAVVQAVSRVIDGGMSLPEALEAPRVAMAGGGLNAETSPDVGWTSAQIAEMRALGLDVNETPRTGAFGRVHGIQYDPATRSWIGAADPDWEGTARGPSR